MLSALEIASRDGVQGNYRAVSRIISYHRRVYVLMIYGAIKVEITDPSRAKLREKSDAQKV